MVAGGTYLDEFHAFSQQVTRLVMVGGVVLSLLLAAFLYWLINKLIVKPLQQKVLPVFNELAEGRYDSPLDIGANDEVGQLMQGLQSMQIQQGFNFAESRRVELRWIVCQRICGLPMMRARSFTRTKAC